MTAEIAVLNKDAVALAADSAVTIAGQKTYQTTNKLFSLSREQPVGIMIYGDSELCGVPWETIIKLYRKEIGNSERPHLENYVDEFIDFIEKKISHYLQDNLEDNLLEYAENYLHKLADKTDTEVEQTLKTQSLNKRQISTILRKHINNDFSHWEQQEKLNFGDEEIVKKLQSDYVYQIEELIDEILENHSVSKVSTNRIVFTIVDIFCSHSANITGVVFSGFGENEIFPKLIENQVECMVFNKLKYTSIEREITNKEEQESLIVPFAQIDTVGTFVAGVSPNMFNNMVVGLSEVLMDIEELITDELSNINLSTRKKNTIINKYNNLVDESRKNYIRFIHQKTQDEHINPLLEAVEFLPKNEMAEVAESLVSITSFRQKISLNQETVGGAIDVAVVSKTDGFVWIRRKHYFPADLNPMFMSKYFAE